MLVVMRWKTPRGYNYSCYNELPSPDRNKQLLLFCIAQKKLNTGLTFSETNAALANSVVDKQSCV
jgi:hypothetical protein